MLGVGNGIANDILEEDLEDGAGLLVDEAGDTLDTTTTGETTNGGLGDAVCAAIVGLPIKYKKLAVYDVPMSGTPAQLLAWAGIDAHAIVHAVLDLLK